MLLLKMGWLIGGGRDQYPGGTGERPRTGQEEVAGGVWPKRRWGCWCFRSPIAAVAGAGASWRRPPWGVIGSIRQEGHRRRAAWEAKGGRIVPARPVVVLM